MMNKTHVILYQVNENKNFTKIIGDLRSNNNFASLSIIGKFSEEIYSGLYDYCLKSGISKKDFKIYDNDNNYNLYALINNVFFDNFNCDYFLLLSNNIKLAGFNVSTCVDYLSPENSIGVNPLFLNYEQKYISCMGLVFDSKYFIKYLYEGLSISNPLANKQRFFQIANPACLLLKSGAIRAVNGIDIKKGNLTFIDFCIRLSKRYSDCFSVCPEARVLWEPDLNTLAIEGLWNSYAMRGKLAPGIVKADYPGHVLADNLQYTVTDWLNEGVATGICEDANNKWLAWRHDPRPESLLNWLYGMDKEKLVHIIPIIQNFPCFLPAQFQYYEALSRHILNFATKENMASLAEAVEKWRKRSRLFHYRELIPAMKLLSQAGLYDASLDTSSSTYDAWLEISDKAKTASIAIDKNWPKIAIAMPVYKPDPDFLRQAIDSVLSQTYANWELCIAEDASHDEELKNFLRHCQQQDSRIKIVFRQENGHICRATNSAVELADAPYTAFMDQDDLLSPDSLAIVAQTFVQEPNLALIYSDSDHIDADNVRRTPHFKTDYNREMNAGYHLSVYATDIFKNVGMLRPGLEGSQDQDLFLRVTEKCQPCQIRHIPKILYHWRIHGDSASGSVAAKPYVLEATKKVKEDMTRRRGIKGEIVKTEINNLFLIRESAPDDLSAAVVLLANTEGMTHELTDCLIPLQEQYGVNIYLQPLFRDLNKFPISDRLNINYLDFSGQNWIMACNNAINSVTEESVLFLATSLSPIKNCEPLQLILNANREGYAMVGSMLWRGGALYNGGYYPASDGAPFPLLAGMDREIVALCNWSSFVIPHEVIGVDWRCMAVRARLLRDRGGFDAALGQRANIDFCMRQRQKQMANIVSLWGQWELTKEICMETENSDDCLFVNKWGAEIARCGLRNPNLDRARDNDWKLIF